MENSLLGEGPMKVTDIAEESNTSRVSTARHLSQSLTEKKMSLKRWPNSLFVAVFCFALLLGFASPQAQAQSEQILYSFTGATGQDPWAGLIMDGSGNLYGTTREGGANGYGTVFELVNSSGTYSEKLLHSFTPSNGDGAYPYGGLIMDASGNLYGTTIGGGPGNGGTVFELVKSSGYSEQLLHSFTNSEGVGGADGADPVAGLIMDGSGNLYGTTTYGGTDNYGTVFELVNSSSGYFERTLYSFPSQSPDDGGFVSNLIMDGSGNLYGTTQYGGTDNQGTVYELVNSSGSYSEKVLYSFTGGDFPGPDGAEPFAGLIMDASGNLYGTTTNGGTVNGGIAYELVNSSGTYSEKVLYNFPEQYTDDGGTISGLIMDGSGNLYGTTTDGGTDEDGAVYELANSSGTYSFTVLYSFAGSGGDGANPFAGLIMDASGNLYGTTQFGGNPGDGTVFELLNTTIVSPPGFASINATTFLESVAGSFTVTASGSPAPALTESGTLPSGVNFADNGNGTGTLAGTPASGSAGTYPITFTATNSAGSTTQSFTLTVDLGVAFTSGTSTTFTVGSAGSFTVTTVGTPTSALSESGSLPSGVTFLDNGNDTGTLSGTPAPGTIGTYPITFTASNGASSATQNFTLSVNQGPAITSGSATTFAVGTAGSFLVTATGTPTPALSENGTPPAGVTFVDNGNGTATLSGTPAAGSGGSYPLVITAANGVGSNSTQSFTLTVSQNLAITSGSMTTFTVGSTGFFSVTTTGFPVPALTASENLPTGVTFTDNGNGTATLSGIPAADSGGTYPLTITASNGGVDPNAIQSFTLVVNQGVAILTGNSTTFTVGVAGSFTVATTGVPLPALTATGGFPGGINFVDNGNGTGTLSGTPVAGSGGSYAITFTANNGVGTAAMQSFTLMVNQGPGITSTNTATFTEQVAGSFTVTTSGDPTPALTYTGTLPSGVNLFDNGNGTATLSGTPAAGSAGQYGFTITASNGVSPNATQTFTLTVMVLNTPTGANVAVTPVDTTTGTSPVSMTFSNVTQPGSTTLTTSSSGPTGPTGYQLGAPPVYYNLSTTATYTGIITVCVNYASISFPSGAPSLWHYSGGTWTNITTSVNTATMTVCGTTSSLSPFALFAPNTVQVTVGTSPAGLAFSVDGTTYTSSQMLVWTVGSVHTLATTSPQTPTTGTQYTFTNWSDGGAISHSVTAQVASSYTASFSTAYQLTTGASPSNGGTVSPASGAYYASGTVVNLTATANSGYTFSVWTGPVANANTASTTVTMNAPASVTANFATEPLVSLTTVVNLPPTVYLDVVLPAIVAVTNNGTATLDMGTASLTVGSGTPTNDFTLIDNYPPFDLCSSTLAPRKTCYIAIVFLAGKVGTLSATLNIPDNAPGSPQQLTFSVIVINPKVKFTPPSMSFGKIKHTTTSTLDLTLSNPGTTPTTITGIGITGTNAENFTQTNNCPSSLAPNGGYCTIAVTFKPGAVGTFSANLAVNDNAPLSPQAVPLSGTGD
jgi:large repetitive protein